MARPRIDLEKLRSLLGGMSTADLRIIAGRAAELVPTAKLRTLFGDIIPLEALAQSEPETTPREAAIHKRRISAGTCTTAAGEKLL